MINLIFLFTESKRGQEFGESMNKEIAFLGLPLKKYLCMLSSSELLYFYIEICILCILLYNFLS